MAEENKKTISVFCANEQTETPHGIDVDGNGEVLLTCECGRFLKFPKGMTGTQIKASLPVHKDANEGQITVESLEQEKQAIIDELFAE